MARDKFVEAFQFLEVTERLELFGPWSTEVREMMAQMAQGGTFRYHKAASVFVGSADSARVADPARTHGCGPAPIEF